MVDHAPNFIVHIDAYGLIYDSFCKTIELAADPVYLSYTDHTHMLCMGWPGILAQNVYYE